MRQKRSIYPRGFKGSKSSQVPRAIDKSKKKKKKSAGKHVVHDGLPVIRNALKAMKDKKCSCKELLRNIIETVKEESINEPYTRLHAQRDLAAIKCNH